MSIRNFDALFEPKTIVIVTAREGARQFEPILLRNLREAGFSHTIMTVNSADTIDARVSAQFHHDVPASRHDDAEGNARA